MDKTAEIDAPLRFGFHAPAHAPLDAPGGIVAAICCATPLLAIGFGALGVTAWLSNADYVLIPALLICLGLVGLGLYRRRSAAQACCIRPLPNKAPIHE